MSLLGDVLHILPAHVTRRLIVYSLGFWAPLIIFLLLANEVWEREPLPGDTTIIAALQAVNQPWLTQLAMLITDLAGSFVVIGVGMGIIISLYMAHRRRDAVFVALAAGGAVVINTVLKLLFARSRPDVVERAIIETGYSFPSGHSMIAAALAVSIILLCWRTRWRWLAIIGGVAYFGLVGLSRVYLGVHYPSDVVGGWCVSLLWVFVVYKALGTFAPSLPQTKTSV